MLSVCMVHSAVRAASRCHALTRTHTQGCRSLAHIHTHRCHALAHTHTHRCHALTHTHTQVLLRCVDLFSPAEAEAVSMVGPGTPLEMAHRWGVDLHGGRAGLFVVGTVCCRQNKVAPLSWCLSRASS